MQTPLAIAIISGLLFALPLVLMFLPALYLVLQGIFPGRKPGIAPPDTGDRLCGKDIS